MEFNINNGYSIDYKEVATGAYAGVIYGPDIQNGSQAAVGISVDKVIDALKALSFEAQIPEEVWDDLKSMIKEYGFN